jgi:hypothetical protein
METKRVEYGSALIVRDVTATPDSKPGPSDIVCRYAYPAIANIGSTSRLPSTFVEPFNKNSNAANIVASNTEQMKSAFHHGWDVPYGIAVRHRRTSKEPKRPWSNKAAIRKRAGSSSTETKLLNVACAI